MFNIMHIWHKSYFDIKKRGSKLILKNKCFFLQDFENQAWLYHREFFYAQPAVLSLITAFLQRDAVAVVAGELLCCGANTSLAPG